jgi:hypothetical protein
MLLADEKPSEFDGVLDERIRLIDALITLLFD